MKTVRIDPCTDPLWCDLLARYDCDVFHSPDWLRCLATTYGWQPQAYVLIDDEGMPLAGVPFFYIDDIWGERVVSLPFSDYCNPLVTEKAHWLQLEAALLAQGCPVTLRCLQNPLLTTTGCFVHRKSARWHGIPLNDDVDTIWESFDRRARQAVHKAMRHDIQVIEAHDKTGLQAFYDMHHNVRKRKYRLLTQSYSFFETIWDAFMPFGNGLLLLATHQDVPVAGGMFLRWRNNLVYKFSTSNPDFLPMRPCDLLVWTGIQKAKAQGCDGYLDFGLSDWEQEGLHQFKRKFGAIEKTITFLNHEAGVDGHKHVTHLKELLPQITHLLTEPTVPDTITREAGDLIYRCFA